MQQNAIYGGGASSILVESAQRDLSLFRVFVLACGVLRTVSIDDELPDDDADYAHHDDHAEHVQG